MKIAGNPFSSSSYALPFWQPPGYTFLLALFIKAGMGLCGIVLLQQAVGVVSVLLLYGLGLRWYGGTSAEARSLPNMETRHETGSRADGWVALGAILLAVCPAVLFYETRLLKPAWTILLLLILLHLYASPRLRGRGLLLGLVTGLLCLFEAYFLLLAVGLVALLFRQTWRTGLACAAAVILVIAPVTVANSWAARGFIPIASNGGVNLHIGNNAKWVETYNTLPGWEWKAMICGEDRIDATHAERARERDVRFGRRALAFMVQQPGQALSGWLQKLFMTFSASEMFRDLDMSVEARVPISNLVINSMIILLFLTALPYQRREAVLLLALIALLLLVNTVFFPSSRNRLPMLALMCAGLPALVRCHNIRALAMGAGWALVVVLAGSLLAEKNVDRTGWHALRVAQTAEKLLLQGQHEEADLCFRHALAEKPVLSTLQRYGEFLLFERANPEGAIACFSRIITTYPAYPDAYFYLGYIRKKQRDTGDARRYYRTYMECRNRLGYPRDHDQHMLAEARNFCTDSGAQPIRMYGTPSTRLQYRSGSDANGTKISE